MIGVRNLVSVQGDWMTKLTYLAALFGALVSFAAPTGVVAKDFDIPKGDLKSALDEYRAQSGEALIVLTETVKGARTKGAKGDLSPDVALMRILEGTGFVARRDSSGMIAIVPSSTRAEAIPSEELAAAPAQSAPGAALETVTVTSSKIGGDVQNIPISITALSQEQLTATQTTGGPDLVKQVPNLTFTKTNFTGYSINIRGIGTQAISVTTDPAVAVAFNDIPFIRNHFFEQEFYDVSQVQVLRGPQGTLYGRNATAGVVNLSSAKPIDQFEAMASIDIGNYGNRRPEGMINIPIVDDRLDLRVAGEWTKRQGYSFNELTNQRIDGRDLWSGRVSLRFKPSSNLDTTLIWEHFSEDDDRMRTAKQLCKYSPDSASVAGLPGSFRAFSQGCLPTSLYSADAFEVPNGLSLPLVSAGVVDGVVRTGFDPYLGETQSRNLRVIESSLNPVYKSKNDTLELNSDYQVSPALTFTSQTGYNHDFLWSTEDYNRFNSAPGAFDRGGSSDFAGVTLPDPAAGTNGIPSDSAIFCDPQLGCSDRIVAEDLSDEHAWQLSQEFRLTSNFNGPFNFSVGGNFLHYETEENYYVFGNALTVYSVTNLINAANGCVLNPSPSTCSPATLSAGGLPYTPGVSDNRQCLLSGYGGFNYQDPSANQGTIPGCPYIDPNPISNLNNEGHNYFLSQNPYTLNSYAAFGEAYYNIVSDLKLTTGLRWTDDRKHFVDIPSELLVSGYGYPSTGVVDQQWNELTGRAAINWTPKLDFTDQTLLYGSYAHGYKAGGANPPGAILLQYAQTDIADPVHPLTFKPEFIDAFEFGSKNTLLDGALTINGDVFYYNYENYQISEIVDRTAINLNFDAHVKGAEIESTYEPIPGLRFNFAGGWEDTALAQGSQAIDLIDRTAGHSGWLVIKRFPTQASNCILPAYVEAATSNYTSKFLDFTCGEAYDAHVDPVTYLPYTPNPIHTDGGDLPPGVYPGFDPLSVDPAAPANVNNGLGLPPNNGEGFYKNLSGNKLPNAPPFTVSFGAQYTVPLTEDWAGTLRGDYYWQDYSWARVENDNPYDRLRGYTNVNLTLIFTNQGGWQVMLYDKNVFNETAITGDFLNSDDSGLTTNVFLTDPKLIGIRVTKNW
jgi:outer membrane receptor protein involved in Fe transport